MKYHHITKASIRACFFNVIEFLEIQRLVFLDVIENDEIKVNIQNDHQIIDFLVENEPRGDTSP